MGARNNVYYNYHPHRLLNARAQPEKKSKCMATQFINLITSKLHSYKETEAHLVSTKAGKKRSSLKAFG